MSTSGLQTNPVATFDAVGNNVSLSAPGAIGSVQTGNPLIVASYANQQTDVGISPVAPLTLGAVTYAGSSEISNTVDSSGSLALGSSQASLSNIIVADQAGVPSTFIKGLGGSPQLLLATTTLPAQTPPAQYNTTFPTPTGEGLYCVMGCAQSTNQPSRQAQFSVIAYVNLSGQVQMGGSGLGDVGSIGTSDALLIYPQQGGANFNLAYTGSGTVVGFSIYAFKLSGPISGTF
jgi:hypothetical protein